MGVHIPGAKNVLPRYSKPRVAGEPLGVHKPIGKRPPPSLKGGRLTEVLLGKEGLAYKSLYPPGFFALRCAAFE